MAFTSAPDGPTTDCLPLLRGRRRISRASSAMTSVTRAKAVAEPTTSRRSADRVHQRTRWANDRPPPTPTRARQDLAGTQRHHQRDTRHALGRCRAHPPGGALLMAFTYAPYGPTSLPCKTCVTLDRWEGKRPDGEAPSVPCAEASAGRRVVLAQMDRPERRTPRTFRCGAFPYGFRGR